MVQLLSHSLKWFPHGKGDMAKPHGQRGTLSAPAWVFITFVLFLHACLYSVRDEHGAGPCSLVSLLSQHTSPVTAQWATHILKLHQVRPAQHIQGETTVLSDCL